MASLCYRPGQWSERTMERCYGMRLVATRPQAIFPWYCLTDHDGHLAVVAVSGTSKIDHWYKANVFFQPVRVGYAGCKAHAGASWACDEIFGDIEGIIEGYRHVVFVGHSFGGSLATLMTLRTPHAMGVTFGAPPILDAELDADVLNLVLDMDVVPRIMGHVYHHAGRSMVIGQGGLADVDRESMMPFIPAVNKILHHHNSYTYSGELKALLYRKDMPSRSPS